MQILKLLVIITFLLHFYHISVSHEHWRTAAIDQTFKDIELNVIFHYERFLKKSLKSRNFCFFYDIKIYDKVKNYL